MTLTKEETTLIQTGFAHMVDRGYGKIETVAEVIKVLRVSLEQARRQQNISKAWREENPNADTVVAFLEPMISHLEMRTGA